MKLNKLIYTLFLITIFAVSSNAQTENGSRNNRNNNNQSNDFEERMRSEKVAFISNYLDLSTEEAQDFWPIYNEFEKKSRDSELERMNIEAQIRDADDNLSNREVNNLIERLIQTHQDDADIMSEYYNKFQEILPPKKVLKLSQSEEQFRRVIFQRYMGNRDSDRN